MGYEQCPKGGVTMKVDPKTIAFAFELAAAMLAAAAGVISKYYNGESQE